MFIQKLQQSKGISMGKIVGKVFEKPKEITIEELISIANEKGLKSLNKEQLKRVATELGLEYDPKINKDDLIALIEENQGEE